MFSPITTISDYFCKPCRLIILHVFEDLHGTDAIVDVGFMDNNRQRNSQDIHYDMLLYPLDFLVAVYAPAFIHMVWSLNAPWIDHSKARAFLSSQQYSDKDVQSWEEFLKRAFVLPFVEIIEDGIVRRKIFGLHPPLATRFKRQLIASKKFLSEYFRFLSCTLKNFSITFLWLSVRFVG